jgi:hypothetical protein
VLPYPKGDNSEDYVLGQYLMDTVIDYGNSDIKIPTEATLW